MSDVSHWEKKFVDCFIRKDKRDRYLAFLKGKKHRQKILDRLNHNLDYLPNLAEELAPEARNTEGLLALLRSHHVNGTCYLMADGNEHDGLEVLLEHGVKELIDNAWGALLICPPKPIVIYKEEDIGRMFLLRKP